MTGTGDPVGPPPHAPESGAVFASLPPFPPLTVEAIPFLRAAEFIPRPTDISLIIGRPSSAAGPP